jgi:hypothetical protein
VLHKESPWPAAARWTSPSRFAFAPWCPPNRDHRLVCVDAYARELALWRRNRMFGSATQASRANQA